MTYESCLLVHLWENGSSNKCMKVEAILKTAAENEQSLEGTCLGARGSGCNSLSGEMTFK